MNERPADTDDEAADSLDEIRQAAGAVVASLKWFVEATERVVEDPAAFSHVVDSGRSVLEAFVGGFAEHATPSEDETGPPTAQGEDPSEES